MATNGRPDKRPAYVSPVDDHCPRCGGLMVMEHYLDLQDDRGQIGMTALRCTGCGEVVPSFYKTGSSRHRTSCMAQDSASMRSLSKKVNRIVQSGGRTTEVKRLMEPEAQR